MAKRDAAMWLLEAGRRDGPRDLDASRRRTLRALGLGSSTALWSSVAHALKLWLSIAAVVVTSGSTASPSVRVMPAAGHVGFPAYPIEIAQVPAPPPAIPPPAPKPEKKKATATMPELPPISEELAAIDGARRSLAGGNPSACIAALDAYAKRFTRPRLMLEANVIRVEALDALGRKQEARTQGAAVLNANPSSAYSARLRSLIGEPSVINPPSSGQ